MPGRNPTGIGCTSSSRKNGRRGSCSAVTDVPRPMMRRPHLSPPFVASSSIDHRTRSPRLPGQSRAASTASGRASEHGQAGRPRQRPPQPVPTIAVDEHVHEGRDDDRCGHDAESDVGLEGEGVGDGGHDGPGPVAAGARPARDEGEQEGEHGQGGVPRVTERVGRQTPHGGGDGEAADSECRRPAPGQQPERHGDHGQVEEDGARAASPGRPGRRGGRARRAGRRAGGRGATSRRGSRRRRVADPTRTRRGCGARSTPSRRSSRSAGSA